MLREVIESEIAAKSLVPDTCPSASVAEMKLS